MNHDEGRDVVFYLLRILAMALWDLDFHGMEPRWEMHIMSASSSIVCMDGWERKHEMVCTRWNAYGYMTDEG